VLKLKVAVFVILTVWGPEARANFISLNYTGAYDTVAEGINNNGQIVGYQTGPMNNIFEGFLFDGLAGSGWLMYRTKPAATKSMCRPSPSREENPDFEQRRRSPSLEPRWYIAADRNLVAVEIKTAGRTIQPGAAKVLFPVRLGPVGSGFAYDVAKDGHFLIPTPVGEQASVPFPVVLNWTVGLKR